jgi:hypothetical protein
VFVGCEKDAKRQLVLYSKCKDIERSRKLFAVIKKRNLPPDEIVGAFNSASENDQKKRIFDLAFTLENEAAIDIVAKIEWSAMPIPDANSLFWGSRLREIDFLEKKFQRPLQKEMPTSEYKTLIEVNSARQP